MKTPTKRGLAALLTLSLSACGAATQHGSMASPACVEDGESQGATTIATSPAPNDSMRYYMESGAEADEGPAPQPSSPQSDSPGRYEPSPAPSTTGGGSCARPAMMQPAPPPSVPAERRQGSFDGAGATSTIDVGPRFDRLLSLQGDLGGVLALSSPNCPRARDLRGAICELSEHICQIADDNPDAEDARVRCRDGRDRCERATEQVSEGCGD